MSAPAFVWAFQKGHELKLSAHQLVLLLYMADQANCVGSFYTGQARMAKYTRLCVRTIRELIPQLAELGLIRVMATPGKATQYHILRQPVGEAATAAQATASAQAATAAQANGAGHTQAAAAVANPTHPGNSEQAPRQFRTVTPAAAAADPSSTQEEDPRARARAREARQDSNSGGEGGTPPPAPPPKAPVLGTTSGGTQSYIPARSSDAFLDDPSPDDALPKAEADTQAVALAAQQAIAELTKSLRMRAYPPGRRSELTVEEMIAVCEDKPAIKPLYLPEAVLRAHRLELAERAAARGNA